MRVKSSLLCLAAAVLVCMAPGLAFADDGFAGGEAEPAGAAAAAAESTATAPENDALTSSDNDGDSAGGTVPAQASEGPASTVESPIMGDSAGGTSDGGIDSTATSTPNNPIAGDSPIEGEMESGNSPATGETGADGSSPGGSAEGDARGDSPDDANDNGNGVEGETADPTPEPVPDPVPVKTSIKTAKVTGVAAKYTYTGNAKKPRVTVKLGGITLALNKQYKVAYSKNVNAGTARVTITGLGDYKDQIVVTFKIAAKGVKTAKLVVADRVLYRGSAPKPRVTVKLGGKTLKAGRDYVLVYKKNNKRSGNGYAVITGKGNYAGKTYQKFRIVPKMVIAVVENHYYRVKSVVNWLNSQGYHAVWVKGAAADPSKYDGLVLPGGVCDVTPSLYGEKNSSADQCDLNLDKSQMSAVKRFAKAGRPILGVCRGAQVINVALGGTLYQDIHGYHRGMQTNTVKKDSWLASGFGTSITMYHYHHQAVKTLAKNLVATSWTTKSSLRIIEAYEHVSKPIYGVQFHPELSGSKGNKLARMFGWECKKRMR